jgi:hydroxymethylbilane synthase
VKLRISARQSDLAKWQAFQVGNALKAQNQDLEIEYLFRESLGDKNQEDPLWKMPAKGVFTQDFFLDLIEEKTDMIVHSWKDLPTDLPKETMIAATLPRADQRDLLLFKKSSFGKKDVRVFTSSPRRALNVKSFLNWSLPWTQKEITFQNIRGNIPTRVRKWLADPNVDGLILAKAAFDRLLQGSQFQETKDFLKGVITTCDWMVLPLSENPNAAAQGSLAIEIKSSRNDILQIVQKLNCESSFRSADTERQILKSFGGGCHLALGMSFLIRDYGDIKIVQGLTPAGEPVRIKEFSPKKKLPAGVIKNRLEFEALRKPLGGTNLDSFGGVFVTKFDAWPKNIKTYSGVVWTAGNETWKKLAQAGIWVQGSNESLGEHENFQIDHFFNEPIKWARLSHSSSKTSDHKIDIPTYDLEFSLISQNCPDDGAFLWTSPQEFDVAVKRFPELRERLHITGPGRTYKALCERLGSDKNVFIEIF